MRRFERYLDLLASWNKVHRLTGLRSEADIVRHLFEDALLFLSRLPEGPLRMADIGAGAGIPGIPMWLIRRDISLTLIEARRKRVSFLSTVKRELALPGLTVLEGRADELLAGPQELAGLFDVVVARAVGPIRELLPTAMAYLTTGGLFLAGGAPIADPPVGQLRSEIVRFDQLGLSRTFWSAVKLA